MCDPKKDKIDGQQQARKVDSRQYREGAQTGQQFGGKTNRIEKMLRFLKEGSTCRAGGSLNPEWRQGLQEEGEAARKLFISPG